MPTDLEYAQLANRVYNRTDEDGASVAMGWTEIVQLSQSTYNSARNADQRHCLNFQSTDWVALTPSSARSRTPSGKVLQ